MKKDTENMHLENKTKRYRATLEPFNPSTGCFTCLSRWASGSSTKGKATAPRAKCCQTPWALGSELAKWSVAEPATATPLDKECACLPACLVDSRDALANELQKQHLRKGKNQPFVNWCNSSSHFMQIEFNQLPFILSSSSLTHRKVHSRKKIQLLRQLQVKSDETAQLLIKPYVNEVNLIGKNPPLKFC